MKREIEFRAKSIDGYWVSGDLHLQCKYPHIHTAERRSVPIDPTTIGQFTGLVDGKGIPIYEGDIVQWGDSEHKIKQVVEFRNGAFGYVYDTKGSFVPYAANTNFDFAALGTDKRFEVIGNVFDNPSLAQKPSQKPTLL